MADTDTDRFIYKCSVLRSALREDTYLYLHILSKFEDLPDELQRLFQDGNSVMTLDLAQRQTLAQADIGRVREALREQGYYLQLPPKVSVEELINRTFG